ncbi:MAG: pilus assembly protein PilP [Wenzhouxiangellaceae bacterium]
MRRFIPFAVVLPVVLVAACSSDRRDLEQWVQEVLARPPAPVEPIPPVITPEPVVYEAYDLPDPFLSRGSQEAAAESTAGTGPGDGPRPDPDRRREYLERFPLDALEMVGTIGVKDQDYALVADPDGTIHRVREGNYLGQNHGRITRITPVAIELVELVPNGTGGWMEREARIALSETGEQG